MIISSGKQRLTRPAGIGGSQGYTRYLSISTLLIKLHWFFIQSPLFHWSIQITTLLELLEWRSNNIIKMSSQDFYSLHYCSSVWSTWSWKTQGNHHRLVCQSTLWSAKRLLCSSLGQTPYKLPGDSGNPSHTQWGFEIQLAPDVARNANYLKAAAIVALDPKCCWCLD